MAFVITRGATIIVPTQVLSISTDQESRTIVHDILGRVDPDITMRGSGLRTGTLEIGFAGQFAESESDACRQAHATSDRTPFQLSSDVDRKSLEMLYVVSGRVSRELEDTTRDAWVVRVDYQEVYG